MIRMIVGLFLFIFMTGGSFVSAGEDVAPIIFFEKTAHTFPSVFEGEELTHTFGVFNHGTEELRIKKIQPT